MTLKHIVTSFILVLTLASCGDDKAVVVLGDDFFEDKEAMVSEEEAREFTLKFLSKVPKAVENSYWPYNGHIPAENLLVKSNFEDYESYSVGDKPKSGLHLTSSPVIAEGVIYTLDGKGVIQARNLQNLDQLIWEVEPEAEYSARNRENSFFRGITNLFYDSDDFLGGNISYSLGTIYLATKRGNVGTFDAKTGEQRWLKSIGVPIRSVPIAQDGNMVFTTIDNRTFNLNSKTGEQRWTHTGYSEKSKLYGSPSSLIIDDNVLVTYSSGEIFLLKLKNGVEKWSDIISPMILSRLNPSVNDIHQTPVYYKNLIFLVTGDGSLFAHDYKTGDQVWELSGQSITKRPWPIGEFLFTANARGDLIGVAAKTGRVVWKSKLASSEDIEDDDLKFTNPIIANGQILVADNNGTLRSYGADDGAVVFETSIPTDVYLRPVTGQGKLFLINNKSTIVEYK